MDGRGLIFFFLFFSYVFSNKCDNNNFLCQNGKCLPRDLVCNGFFDCDDGEDENDCK